MGASSQGYRELLGEFALVGDRNPVLTVVDGRVHATKDAGDSAREAGGVLLTS